MDRFGCSNISQALNGQRIHSLENVMPLNTIVHDPFNALKLWFEPTLRSPPKLLP